MNQGDIEQVLDEENSSALEICSEMEGVKCWTFEKLESALQATAFEELETSILDSLKRGEKYSL